MANGDSQIPMYIAADAPPQPTETAGLLPPPPPANVQVDPNAGQPPPDQSGTGAMTPEQAMQLLYPQQAQQPQAAAPVPYHKGMLQGIMDALAPQVQYNVDDQGRMRAQAVPNTPGTFAKRVIAGALQGFSRAASVQPGPGYVGRAAAAGVGGGLNLAEQQNTQGRQQATEDYNREQQATLRHAQQVMTSQAYATAQLQYLRQGFALEQDKAHANSWADEQITSMHMQDMGVIHSFQELMDKAKTNPALHDAIAQGRIFQTPNYTNGVRDGIRAAIRPVGETMLAKDLKIPYLTGETDPKTGMPIKDYHTIPAGSPASEAYHNADMAGLAAIQADKASEAAQRQKEQTELQRQQLQIEAGKAKAEEAAEYARATFYKAQSGEGGNLTPDSFGFTPAPMPQKERDKRFDSWHPQVVSLINTEQHYKDFKDGIDAINRGDWNGARSISELFNAIGLSTVSDKGGLRITKNIISEHEHARGFLGELQNKLGHFKEGDVITKQQLKDYAGVAADKRAEDYITMINAAHGQGLGGDFMLPQGNGQTVDPSTIKIFLTLANGNVPMAISALEKNGWNTKAGVGVGQ